MLQNAFTWNPKGLRKLSFKDFKAFPISPQKQLVSAIVCMAAVIIGSTARLLLPTLNLNFLVYALIGYFMVERVHPNPIVGSLTVTVGVIGLAWTLVMLVPDAFWFPAAFMLVLAANIFIGLFAGAVVAAVTKPD